MLPSLPHLPDYHLLNKFHQPTLRDWFNYSKLWDKTLKILIIFSAERITLPYKCIPLRKRELKRTLPDSRNQKPDWKTKSLNWMDVLLPKLLSHKLQATRNPETPNYWMMLLLFVPLSRVNMITHNLPENKNWSYFKRLRDS